ncbi:MAG: endonuclease I, partial [Bacteroidota bacterium]
PDAPGPTPEASGATGGALWINEIHYDNAGDDVGEGIEIAGPDGTPLDGWTLVLVNGSDGSVYRTVPLAGTLVGDGIGTEWVPVEGLQNGSPDGAALVAPDRRVVEALSWEGTLVARGGAVNGIRFEDIGVQETSSDAPGMSLQRTGRGRAARDFRWTSGVAASPGWLNAGQQAAGGR